MKLGISIEKNEIALSAAKETLDYVRKKDYQVAGCVHPLSQITFRVSHRPRKIVCTGTNYEDYRKLIGIPFSSVPLVFLKSPSAVTGHEETIYLPSGYGIFYHEGEIEGIGVLGNPVEDIDVDRKYAQQINVGDVG